MWFPTVAKLVHQAAALAFLQSCVHQQASLGTQAGPELSWKKKKINSLSTQFSHWVPLRLLSIPVGAGACPPRAVGELMAAGCKKEESAGHLSLRLHSGSPPFHWEIIRDVQFEKCRSCLL